MPVMPGALWCSVTARPPIDGIEVIDAAELENPPPGHVLLIDLPFGTVEERWLAAVRTLARQPRVSPRRFVALGLLGNIKLLGLDEVVALHADGFSEQLTPPFLAELQHLGAQRLQLSRRLDDYRRISRNLNLGCARFHGADLTLVWADDVLTQLLGTDAGTASSTPPLSLRDVFEHDVELDHLLDKVSQIGQGTTTLRLRNKRNIWATALRPADAPDSLLLLLHDSNEIASELMARNRVADLLEEVGFAYFVCYADGHTVFSNRKDQEILEATAELTYGRPRREWFADPGEFDEIVKQSLSRPLSKRVLLRTQCEREVWAEAAFRTVKGSNEDLLRIEAAYRDINLVERLAQALSDVSALEFGLARTAEGLLGAIVNIVDSTSSMIMVRNEEHRRVFPLCLRGARPFGKRLILKDIEDWWHELRTTDRARIWPKAQIPPSVIELLGENADQMHSLCVLPLVRTCEVTTSAIWLAMPEHPVSEPSAPLELGTLLQLCQRQLRLANTRDSFELIRSLMSRRSEITTLDRLDHFLHDARLLLEQYIPMEGCSIFRVGLEDRAAMLTLSTTSGLEDASPMATYRFGEGMTGTVAQSGERVTFEMALEKDRRGKHIEKVAHPIVTWAGVPMRDRQGRTVGVVRCTNRKVNTERYSQVTGFSEFDMATLRQFADACGVLIELTRIDAPRQRTVARIAHEIRSPIVAIRNNLEFLSTKYTPHDDKTAAKLDDLELDAAILLDQVRKLDVVFNQPGTTAGDPVQQIQLSEILWKTYYTMVPELKARNIKTAPNRPMEVVGRLPKLWLPPAAIAQITFNLFWNAIKYSHHDPAKFRIKVIVEDWDDPYTIRFQDWGIGIDARYRDQIFEENFRTPEARLHDARGLGLGLALSRKLARDLRGDLVLNSNISPTEFVLTLPKSLAHEPPKTSKV